MSRAIPPEFAALLAAADQLHDVLVAWEGLAADDQPAADRVLDAFYAAVVSINTARRACIGLTDQTRQPAARAEQGPPDAAALSAPTDEPGGH